MACALEAVRNDHIGTKGLSLERMLDSGALMNEGHAAALDLIDHVRLRRSARGLHDLNAFLGADADIAIIVGNYQGRHERQVDGKGLGGLSLDEVDLLAQILCGAERGGGQQAETAGFGNCRDQRSAGYPLHAALNDRILNAEGFGNLGLYHFLFHAHNNMFPFFLYIIYLQILTA